MWFDDMNCTSCGALLPPFTLGRCETCLRGDQPTTTHVNKRKRSEYEAHSTPIVPEEQPKKRKRTHSSLSVLFIPFDAGGTSRTKKGLSDSGTRGEIFLSESSSFHRMPFNKKFLNKRDLSSMPSMTPKQLVSMEVKPEVTFSFRPEGPKDLLSKRENGRDNWDIDYERIVRAAIDKLGSAHDRAWEERLFTHVRVGSQRTRLQCGCTRHWCATSRVPRVFPDVIFLSEELKYNQFPDKLTIYSVEYTRMKESALAYNEKGGVSDWKQQISGYVRAAHRDEDEKLASFTAKRDVINNKEKVLLVSKELSGIKLVACGVHFSSKYVNECKNNDEKAKRVLAKKVEWSGSAGVDLLIGDFNFDCSFDPRFMTEYVSGPQYVSVGKRIESVIATRGSNTSQDSPQRFMNAVVTNTSTTIDPNRFSGVARPLVGDQSLEDGYYSDHPWVFVTVTKQRQDVSFEDFFGISTLPMLTWK